MMFYNARNGSVFVGNSQMDYISFGKGNKNLIIIPGLGDGLRTVKGMAVSLARISNSELFLYEDYGHAVYEEAKDFNERVLKYLKR